MKTQFSYIILALLFFSCSKFDKVLEEVKTNNDTIEYILTPIHFIGKKSFGVYQLKELFSDNNAHLIQLKKSRLINSTTKIYYSSSQCISLVTRIEKKSTGGFIDYLISNNLNESDFVCGLNNIYNLNQNEDITQIKIKVKETNSLLTLAIIESD